MSELRYIDSSGIKTLIHAYRAFKQTKRQMVLATVPPAVQRILTIVGVDRIVPVYASVEAALQGLGGQHASG